MKSKSMVKETLIGLAVGLVANLIGIYLYIFFFFDLDEGIMNVLRQAAYNDVLGKIIALGALLNLAAFFLLLKKQQPLRARGVVIATIIAAIGILISKFI